MSGTITTVCLNGPTSFIPQVHVTTDPTDEDFMDTQQQFKTMRQIILYKLEQFHHLAKQNIYLDFKDLIPSEQQPITMRQIVLRALAQLHPLPKQKTYLMLL